MSNFENLAKISGGLGGTDPALFSAVTTDDLLTITDPGYMNDLSVLARLENMSGSPEPTTERGVVKVNDVLFINYAESGDFPDPTSTLGVFYVTFDGSDYNLTAFPELGLGALAAANNLSDLSDNLTALGNLGALYTQTVTVGFADLAAAGQKILQAVGSVTDQFIVRNIVASAAGVNFSGGGGDRNMAIQSSGGTVIYSVLPAAKLQAVTTTASQWGDVGIPYPAVANAMTTSTVAGEDLVATYSGGAADYTAGNITFVLVLEKTA